MTGVVVNKKTYKNQKQRNKEPTHLPICGKSTGITKRSNSSNENTLIKPKQEKYIDFIYIKSHNGSYIFICILIS